MAQKIRWGMIGTGNIAAKFAQDLALLPDADLSAVASRSKDKAHAFAEKFKFQCSHPSCEALAADPNIDVVYIATPHTLHMDNTLLCVNAGKAVLCEKPLAVNARQASRMVEAAQSAGVFLMEAMWLRFFPLIKKLRQLLADQVIGPVEMFSADFGFECDPNPKARALNPDLAGGALLDVGVYPVSLASMVFAQQPERISSLAHLGPTGVDERSAMIFGYPNGALATLSCAVTTETPCNALIIGSKGKIKIHPRCWHPKAATISIKDKPDQLIEIPYQGVGLNYQAAEVMQCIRDKKLQSDIMPLNESLQIMQTMDNIRTQWNLKYPAESL